MGTGYDSFSTAVEPPPQGPLSPDGFSFGPLVLMQYAKPPLTFDRQSATLTARQVCEGQWAYAQLSAADCLCCRRCLADFHVLGAVALGTGGKGVSGVVESDPFLALQTLVDALPRFLASCWHCSPPFAGANSFAPRTSLVGWPDRNLRWTSFFRESPDETNESSDCDVPQ